MRETNERECMHYQTLEGQAVRCLLCPHHCRLEAGQRGLCRGRANIDGKLMAINYARSIGVALDPIEKKPLYHFRPGSRVISLGPNSCNLSCFFCQNSNSSQEECLTRRMSPEELRDLVQRESGEEARQVAFTYTEPLTWYEYIYDFAQLAREVDIVLVTNAFIDPEPLDELLPYVKAMNIDLKSMRTEFYQQHCGATLEPVLRNIRSAFEAGVHLELTNLLIPGLNDSEAEIKELVEFVSGLGKEIPLHFSAYHPAFRAIIPATPENTVLQACRIASRKLDHVYAGNIRSAEFQATLCPNCSSEVISARRQPLALTAEGCCSHCSQPIHGVF
ncbi:MAG: AmmeMemoRadiSam system radical SAM enzyme [Candidatus Cloacimonetes bacterium]|nr:AmmeMemoRadiSam system radical SAM enzyme [Candidatus Cloacimonadota bacterium]HOY84186.1 AmmeMemoRadiSam system radical SAM enzyme [Candidatus Syntrophosphaera sp.]HPH61025.1 AmmeMemoRadiSam system radical SAM enzyme [Candidatus Syntrophosphaera sp.]